MYIEISSLVLTIYNVKDEEYELSWWSGFSFTGKIVKDNWSYILLDNNTAYLSREYTVIDSV